MYNARIGQRIASQVVIHLFPDERRPLASTIQPFHERSSRDIAKIGHHSRITADPIVIVMPSQFGRQQSPPRLDAHHAAYLLEPVAHFLTGLMELLAGRPASR